jgi:hypothetical protein
VVSSVMECFLVSLGLALPVLPLTRYMAALCPGWCPSRAAQRSRATALCGARGPRATSPLTGAGRGKTIPARVRGV